jgi:N-acyl-D-amino-acid deacylase
VPAPIRAAPGISHIRPKIPAKRDGYFSDGMRADITIFNLNEIHAVGTYDDPRRHCRGILYVIVNGTIVMDCGHHTGTHPGRSLRRHP